MPVTSEKFNAVGGLSVGIPPIDIISETGNITAPYADIGNVVAGQGVFGNVSITGNVTAGNIIGNVVGSIVGNIRVPGADTQILFNIGGNIDTSANLTFNPTTRALTVAGNLCVADTVCANFLDGDGSNLTNVYAVTANIAANGLQPNITQLPNIFSISVSNSANFANAGVVHVYGGNSGDVLVTDGSGNLTWRVGTHQIANGTSSVSIPTTGGQVEFRVSNAHLMTVGNAGNVTIDTELWVSGNVRAETFDGNGARIFDIQAPNIVGSFGNISAQDNLTANTVKANHKIMIGNTVMGTSVTTTNSLTPTVVFSHSAIAATITLVGQDTVTGTPEMTVWNVIRDGAVITDDPVSTLSPTALGTKTFTANGSNIELTVTPLTVNTVTWTVNYTVV